jgi:hypothetical protein
VDIERASRPFHFFDLDFIVSHFFEKILIVEKEKESKPFLL